MPLDGGLVLARLASLTLALVLAGVQAYLPIAELDGEMLGTLLAATPLGKVLAVRLVASALLFVALASTRQIFAFALIAVVALVAMLGMTNPSGI